MTGKKILKVTAGLILGGIFLFVFFLYAAIRTKSTAIDKYSPFREWVGEKVMLNRETVVLKEKLRSHTNDRYPYTLLDSLHPDWEYAEARKTLEEPEIEEITVFPAGTELVLEKAIQYTNGVSGSSYPTIFGTIGSGEKTYKVGYQWGKRDMAKNHYGIEECWKFHQAPWQEKPDTTFYALPTAEWW